FCREAREHSVQRFLVSRGHAGRSSCKALDGIAYFAQFTGLEFDFPVRGMLPFPTHVLCKPDPGYARNAIQPRVANGKQSLPIGFRRFMHTPIAAVYSPYFKNVLKVAVKSEPVFKDMIFDVVIMKRDFFMTNAVEQEFAARNMKYSLLHRITHLALHSGVGEIDRKDLIFIFYIGTQQGGTYAIYGKLHVADKTSAHVIKTLNASAQLLDVSPPVEDRESVSIVQYLGAVIGIRRRGQDVVSVILQFDE